MTIYFLSLVLNGFIYPMENYWKKQDCLDRMNAVYDEKLEELLRESHLNVACVSIVVKKRQLSDAVNPTNKPERQM